MTEVQLLAYRIPSSNLFEGGPDTRALNIAVNEPQVIELIGEGWRPANHTVTILNDREVLLTFMMLRDEVPAPDVVPDDF